MSRIKCVLSIQSHSALESIATSLEAARDVASQLGETALLQTALVEVYVMWEKKKC